METPKGTGVIPAPLSIYDSTPRYDPCSKRGLAFTSLTLPLEYDIKSKLLPVKDQLTLQMSPAHVCACIAEYIEYTSGEHKRHLSANYIYHHRSGATDGMVSLDAIQSLCRHGTCSSYLYPSIEELPSRVSDKCSQKFASRYFNKGKLRICAYVQKTPGLYHQDLINLKHAIFHNGPVYMVLPVFNYGPKFWWPSGSYKQLSSQAVAVVGWTTQGFIIRNSWGRAWGDDGYAIYTYDDFATCRHSDLLTIVATETAAATCFLLDDSQSDCKCIIC